MVFGLPSVGIGAKFVCSEPKRERETKKSDCATRDECVQKFLHTTFSLAQKQVSLPPNNSPSGLKGKERCGRLDGVEFP